MAKIKVLKHDETKHVLNPIDVIEAVKEVYQAKATSQCTVFPLIFHEFDPGVADMDIKSGWLKNQKIFGLKLVSWFADNAKKGLPLLQGTVMVFDDQTGQLTGLVDGTYITGIRTGAAGAIGAYLLARKDSKNVLLVGAGHVAYFQIVALLHLFPNLEKIMVFDPMNVEQAERFVHDLPERLKNDFYLSVDGIEISAVREIAKATQLADIVITVTPSRKPMIQRQWVKKGTHFSCIGADMAGKQEIDGHILKDAKIFVDDIQQCIHVGECELPIQEGLISEKDIIGEIGDILVGKCSGRTSDEDITVFDATGTALLDLIVAAKAIEIANQQNIGQTIEL